MGGESQGNMRACERRRHRAVRPEGIHPRIGEVLFASGHGCGNRNVSESACARSKQMRTILFLSTAACLIASELPRSPSGDLTVHEWGTFTSVAGNDGEAVQWDALGGKDDLPRFVNDFGYRCFKWRLSGTVR